MEQKSTSCLGTTNGGLALFALAAVISLNRAGVWARWHALRRRARHRLADE